MSNTTSHTLPPPPTQPTLQIYNSLTKSKQPLHSLVPQYLKWYTCGPTVYDKAHMGHARCYVTFDIIRRTLQNYFGYEICYVMNVTDIDDKIILRARHKHLLDQYKADHPIVTSTLIKYLRDLLGKYHQAKFQGKWPHPTPPEPKPEKWELYIKTATDAQQQLDAAQQDVESRPLLEAFADLIAEDLDSQYGHDIRDHNIFQNLASQYEALFMEDMKALNVLPPSILTRVSEYVPEVVHFVEVIIRNGFAYEADGSVYFDVGKFNDSHEYAKLNPAARGSLGAMEESEGALGSSLKGKRKPEDFALWKRSKSGEPSWDSPWGKGRPGWHIECSAMAGSVLGGNFDIHSGGIDLCFPHHDNELAQAEAHYNNQQWVNYFMHAGHLRIEGLKMSKSLKNFITIEEALSQWTANELRWMFLTNKWDATLEFSNDRINAIRGSIASFTNFFASLKSLLWGEKGNPKTASHRYREAETHLHESLVKVQSEVRDALCDSFDTPGVMLLLATLVTNANKYIGMTQSNVLNFDILKMMAGYITKMFEIFGIDVQTLRLHEPNGNGVVDIESSIMPYLQTLARFRDQVRTLARDSLADNKANVGMLQVCDRLRDVELVELDVLLEDRGAGEASIVKMRSKAEILAERLAKSEQKQSKPKGNDEQKLKALQRLEKGRINEKDIYRTAEYKEWDEDGIPTILSNGEAVTKSARKKLMKGQEAHKKLHLEFLAAESKAD